MNLYKIILLVALSSLNACTYHMKVPSGIITSTSQNSAITTKTAQLALEPSVKNYIHETKTYNWTGGLLFPDTIRFGIGEAVTAGLYALASKNFKSVQVQEEGTPARSKNVLTLIPKIQQVHLELPTLRFTDITAQIQISLEIYVGLRKITTRTISGTGKAPLMFTRESYAQAFQQANVQLMQNVLLAIEQAVQAK